MFLSSILGPLNLILNISLNPQVFGLSYIFIKTKWFNLSYFPGCSYIIIPLFRATAWGPGMDRDSPCWTYYSA